VSKSIFILALLWCSLVAAAPLHAADDDFDTLSFDDAPLDEPIEYPDWFKLSFLNLREDLQEAVQGGKRGLIVYFGQKHCPYCKMLMQVNFAKSDIVAYTRTHFDFVATDIWGDRSLTDLSGTVLTEKTFAEQQQATFTPTLLFYDADGNEALRLRGYYPPYRFRAAGICGRRPLQEGNLSRLPGAGRSAAAFRAGRSESATFLRGAALCAGP